MSNSDSLDPQAPKNYDYTRDVVHFDRQLEHANGSIHQPIHPSVQYTYDSVYDLIDVFQGKKKGNSPYARQGTPSTSALEAKLAMIEEGIGAVCFATGMAAISAVFLTLLKRGDHLVASNHLFGNTASVLITLEGLGIEVSMVDATCSANVEAACRENTKMVFVESVANPGTQVADLEAIGDVCLAKKLVYIVDNTILSACLFKPKNVNASLVIHSLTKSSAGQGQALGGVVIDTGLFDWRNYDNIFKGYRKGDAKTWGLLQIRKKGLRDMGGTLSGQQAHQISLGLETMELRMQRSSDTALTLAQYLEQHPKVSKVNYPKLASHSGYVLANKLFTAGSWLLSFELMDDNDCLPFVEGLQTIISATGLGDTRTLIIPVAHTIFWEMGLEKRQQMGVTEGMIRLSVGLESSVSLIQDIDQALAQL